MAFDITKYLGKDDITPLNSDYLNGLIQMFNNRIEEANAVVAELQDAVEALDVAVSPIQTVFGRTGDVIAVPDDYTWNQIDKTVSDIADITDKSHTDLDDIGTNTHAQVDTHIANVSNPHTVTAAQVGNGTAQWNANKIQDVTVDDTDIAEGKVLQFQSPNLVYAVLQGVLKTALIVDEKTKGTNGGTSTTGWNQRTLNTEIVDDIGVTISSNRVSIGAGTYLIFASAPCGTASGTVNHRLVVRNYTDTTDLLLGTSQVSYYEGISIVAGIITLAATKEIELLQYVSSGLANTGLGTAHNVTGYTERYASLLIIQI